eukprot:2235810-Rhodomonas_salina.1
MCTGQRSADATPRNQTQETTNSVQFVPGMRFLVFDSGCTLTKCTPSASWWLQYGGNLRSSFSSSERNPAHVASAHASRAARSRPSFALAYSMRSHVPHTKCPSLHTLPADASWQHDRHRFASAAAPPAAPTCASAVPGCSACPAGCCCCCCPCEGRYCSAASSNAAARSSELRPCPAAAAACPASAPPAGGAPDRAASDACADCAAGASASEAGAGACAGAGAAWKSSSSFASTAAARTASSNRWRACLTTHCE